ncbi:MAG TPA: Crp/Fnr family transcriptional regulator [Actinomycetes bacterium]|nr:Crp/Fnr family transcriptional regulator [Actinomycetes bacterium]
MDLKVSEAADVVLRTPMFSSVEPAAVAELVPALRPRTYEAGRSVWLQGDPADDLYVLAEGQLKSHRLSRDGGEVILGFTDAIDTAGEVGLFHPSGKRQVNVTAMTATRCWLLDRESLVSFMTRHPTVMRRMLQRLSTVTVKAAESFSNVAFRDIRRRTAAALLALVDEFGEPTASGVRIRLRLSQTTLAAVVAASRENVNRALSGLIDEGVVSQEEGHFLVHDRSALERASAT